LIDIINITKEYRTNKRTIKAVDNVKLTINKGEIFGIVGYSGAGKSSLLRCINLLEVPTSGQLMVDGVDVTRLKGKELRQYRLKIGMIFQHFSLISSKNVFDNVAFALKAAGKTRSEIEARVPKLLDMVGLSDKSQQYPSQLSGGQKQRVGIARALANDPKVLLCDEATSALDPSTTQSILSLLRDINRKLGITMILITHEMEVVKDICHRVAVMQEGKVVEEGPVYDIFANPKQPLAREFIQTVLQFDIPEQLLENRKGTIIKIQFKGSAAEESVVSDALKKYEVDGNILHGRIEYIQDVPLGIFVMELTGTQTEIEKAIGYLRERTDGLEVIVHAA
jgi:D-methionine transport system ATP-binding protein